uniref:Uncharacterized protein n=1 Tax=Octopus bimaculoides TaxID=37653 RepID=A0A0L8H462_OCTBM
MASTQQTKEVFNHHDVLINMHCLGREALNNCISISKQIGFSIIDWLEFHNLLHSNFGIDYKQCLNSGQILSLNTKYLNEFRKYNFQLLLIESLTNIEKKT